MLDRRNVHIDIDLPEMHAHQQLAFSKLTDRFALRAGRRWGKSKWGTIIACNYVSRRFPVGWFAPEVRHYAPVYRDALQILQPTRVSSRQNDFIHCLGGGSFDFWSLDNPLAGLGRRYALVVIDEADSAKKNMKEMWELNIAPTLIDYSGKVIVSSNTKGNDPDSFFWQICNIKEQGWTEFHATTYDNPVIPLRKHGEGHRAWQARREKEMAALINQYNPLAYQQEILADWVDWSGKAFFKEAKLLWGDAPVPYPDQCEYVIAVIDTAIKTKKENDGTAVLYAAFHPRSISPYKLTLLDYDYIQIEGASLVTWLPGVFKRLEELSQECKARRGSAGAWIEDKGSGTILLQQAKRQEWEAHPIDIALTNMGKVERAISVSGYVERDLVKISERCFNRLVTYKTVSRNHLLSQVVGFRVDQKEDTPDDLLDTFCYTISIVLGDSEGN